MLKRRLNLRKVAMIVACLAVIVIFASCGKNGGDDDVNNPAVTGDDVFSVKALAGLWSKMGYSDVYWWEFDSDGHFAYYVGTVSASVNYWNEYFKKGKYRVNGNVIEFYDCQFDSYTPSLKHDKYFDNYKRLDMPDNLLLKTPLQDSKKAENFSLMFEFINAMTMRIVTDGSRSTKEDYDWDFDYHANSHNVAIPTHSIPSVAWPKDKLPADLPEYQNGRIRIVEPLSEPGYYVKIYIDKTTRENIKNYINGLLQEGWTSAYGETDLQQFIEGTSNVCYLNNKGGGYCVLETTNELWSSQLWFIIIW